MWRGKSEFGVARRNRLRFLRGMCYFTKTRRRIKILRRGTRPEISLVYRRNSMILTDALWGLLAGVVVALVVSAVLKWKKKKD
jgi:hypothetical protein